MSGFERSGARAADQLRAGAHHARIHHPRRGFGADRVRRHQGAVHRLGRRARAGSLQAAAARAGSRPNTACCRAPPTPAATARRHAASRAGRTQEIQRLIGRSPARRVRPARAWASARITLDCDVLQADGGTRTAAITGAFVALQDACQLPAGRRADRRSPIRDTGGGDLGGHRRRARPLLDLDYTEDSRLRHRHERGDDRRRRASSRCRARPRAPPSAAAEMDALLALGRARHRRSLVALQQQSLLSNKTGTDQGWRRIA